MYCDTWAYKETLDPLVPESMETTIEDASLQHSLPPVQQADTLGRSTFVWGGLCISVSIEPS